jgi:hypothetical protein
MRIASRPTKTKSNINPRAAAAYQKYLSERKKRKTTPKKPTASKPKPRDYHPIPKPSRPSRPSRPTKPSTNTRPKPRPEQIDPWKKPTKSTRGIKRPTRGIKRPTRGIKRPTGIRRRRLTIPRRRRRR